MSFYRDSLDKYRCLNLQEELTDHPVNLFYLKFDSISVIAYVRTPADRYFSGMQQRIQASYKFTNPYKYKQNVFTPLERWAEFVGIENVYINAFDKTTLIENNVVVDFVKLLEKITKNSFSNFVYSKDKKIHH